MRFHPTAGSTVLVLAVLLCSALARAECEEAVVRAASARLTPARIAAGTRPEAPNRSRCMSVAVSGPEVSAPSFGAFLRRGCTAVAYVACWTVVRSELCGFDVHFEPETSCSIVVLEHRGSGFVGRARGGLALALASADAPALALGAPSDADGDGRQEIVVQRPSGSWPFAVRGRRVLAVTPRPSERKSARRSHPGREGMEHVARWRRRS